MSADPAGLALIKMEREDEGGLKPKESYSIIEATNLYAYVRSNSVRYVDPMGMFDLDYDEKGNETIQAELETKNDIRKAVSMFYLIIKTFPEGDHTIQFIDRDGKIRCDYSSYSCVGIGPKEPGASVSFFLAIITAHKDLEENEEIGADVGFTLFAIPGLKADLSFVTLARNYLIQSFYKTHKTQSWKEFEP